MKINVQQCLHGYSHGHQLLASSTELTQGARRTLLFQSDLSGPKTNSGFETYLTSYPLTESSFFVIAKTWYAGEMPRPGCVWTHSLLIELPDLGKIPELKSLIRLFKRPELNNYRFYENILEVEFEDLFLNYGNERSIEYNFIAKTLYTTSDRSIIIESNNSETYENAILEVWSDQWPRLRRNFSFCTGALSLKILGNKPFDVQVIPQKNRNSITRASLDIEFVNFKDTLIPEWLNIVQSTPKNQLRQFLWSFGADMPGERVNFPKLVELFGVLNEQRADIRTFNDVVKGLLPSSDSGKAFKNSIFGLKKNYGQFPEKDIVLFLLNEHNLMHLNIDDYHLSERLWSLYEKQEIGLSQFIELAIKRLSKDVNDEIFDKLILDPTNASTVFQEHHFLIGKLLPKQQNLHFLESLWQTDYNTQKEILSVLLGIYRTQIPLEIQENILDAKSQIIFELEKAYGQKLALLTLNWYNKSLKEILPDWKDRIFNHYFGVFTDWFKQNLVTVHPKLFIDIFQKRSLEWVLKLPLSHQNWLDSYAVLRKSEGVNLPYISSLFLSKGLKNEMYGSDWLVSMTFNDVYKFAELSQLSGHWNIIPTDFDDYDDNEHRSPVDIFFKMLGFGNTKKNKDVQAWDYCEILIRSVSSKYYKYGWSPQAYLNTFNKHETFTKSLIFLADKKRGVDFLNKVSSHLLKSKKIKGEQFQVKIMEKLSIN